MKSKLKVTWGQCGRKVLMLGKNMAIVFVFLLGSCEHVVGELLGILGADVCKEKRVCFCVLAAAFILCPIPLRPGTLSAYCCFWEVNLQVL